MRTSLRWAWLSLSRSKDQVLRAVGAFGLVTRRELYVLCGSLQSCKLKSSSFSSRLAGACPVHMVTTASSSIPDFGSLLLLQIWGQVECLVPVGSRLSCL